jgi:hypothetical protein
MKYHQDMIRCIFRIFKTTKADEGFNPKRSFQLKINVDFVQVNIHVKLMMNEELKLLVIFMSKVFNIKF